ncbi:hypothetical protein J5N97_015345 [Dioscorea zingiberensis]|uniref:Uncharacterized protein n=1 Tax=Dioscorea zingiberensis TaxID=325984 RepID=A0A9D5CUI9_9LILI|nr:hypothetical protein J5N97_015345 [Dioscorea zingiberensis]
MGNYLGCHRDAQGGKLVLLDGTVHRFEDRVCVAELMLDNPQQLVAELQPVSGGAPKAMPLPADHWLDPKKVYVMLPIGGNKAATLDKARRILSVTRSVFQSRSFPMIGGAFIAGLMKEKPFIKEDKEDEQVEKVRGLEWSSEVFDERPEFLSRQFSSKGWKPGLGTIEERELEMKMKVRHWLF